jgi:2-polyprenyl-3-methyl-5-hydroxy-6-metoxy-1,4-benzoquinol methylase
MRIPLVNNNPRIDAQILQERLVDELARPIGQNPVPKPPSPGPSVPQVRSSWLSKLRTAAARAGIIRMPFLGPALLWCRSAVLLQRTRVDVRRSTQALEQTSGLLQSLDDRLIDIERRRIYDSGQIMLKLQFLEEQVNLSNSVLMERLHRLESDAARADRQQASTSMLGAAGPPGSTERVTHLGMDALFLEMSYAFRGSREEIKQRVAQYLPEMRAVLKDTPEAEVLDIGCGRGEWLEVLRDAGIRARGVDLNHLCVDLCSNMGLSVIKADGLAALDSSSDGALAGVTALHVVEHMPFEDVVHLLDQAHRCLRSGGLLLLETPNPESLMVGGRNFFFDPTHRMPIPPDVLAFVVRDRGYVDVRVERLHPYPPEIQLNETEGSAERTLNQLMFGTQDYCVIARRP